MTVTFLGFSIALAKLSSLGLAVDICGALLLFKFGLPADVSRRGHISIVLEGTDAAEIAKAERYDKLGRLGLFLLTTGFMLQLIGIWV